MGGQHQNVGLAMVVQEALAGQGGERRIVVGTRAPFGVRQLDRTVHHIADHHRVATLGGDIYGDMAGRMARRRSQPDLVVEALAAMPGSAHGRGVLLHHLG